MHRTLQRKQTLLQDDYEIIEESFFLLHEMILEYFTALLFITNFTYY
jgi:hypothetical protein